MECCRTLQSDGENSHFAFLATTASTVCRMCRVWLCVCICNGVISRRRLNISHTSIRTAFNWNSSLSSLPGEGDGALCHLGNHMLAHAKSLLFHISQFYECSAPTTRICYHRMASPMVSCEIFIGEMLSDECIFTLKRQRQRLGVMVDISTVGTGWISGNYFDTSERDINVLPVASEYQFKLNHCCVCLRLHAFSYTFFFFFLLFGPSNFPLFAYWMKAKEKIHSNVMGTQWQPAHKLCGIFVKVFS